MPHQLEFCASIARVITAKLDQPLSESAKAVSSFGGKVYEDLEYATLRSVESQIISQLEWQRALAASLRQAGGRKPNRDAIAVLLVGVLLDAVPKRVGLPSILSCIAAAYQAYISLAHVLVLYPYLERFEEPIKTATPAEAIEILSHQVFTNHTRVIRLVGPAATHRLTPRQVELSLNDADRQAARRRAGALVEQDLES